jgi:hypothetical protein
MNRRRLEAEEIRDSILNISGVLDETPGGPSFDIADDKSTRRTVYGKVSRFKLDTFLQVFDFPNPTISSEGRVATNVPLQRLYFLNSDFANQQASMLAKRIAAEVTDEDKIRKAYRLVYQRPVTPPELDAAIAFLKKEREKPETPAPPKEKEAVANLATKPEPSAMKSRPGAPKAPPPPQDVWTLYVRVLLSSNEFLYLN